MSLGSTLIYARIFENSLERAAYFFFKYLFGIFSGKAIIILKAFKPFLMLSYCLILGKVFLYGYRLQKEQELTI